MTRNSSGTRPQQTQRLAGVSYRLFAQEAVTHKAVCTPHWQRTWGQTGVLPVVFMIQDTTELDFTYHNKTCGLARIGNGDGRGLHQQSVLAVDPARKVPIGLTCQRHHRRQEVPEGETRLQRRQRPLKERESFWWVEASRQIGSALQGVRWVHILARGGDAFGIYDAIRETETDFIIRAAQDRRIASIGRHDHLFDYSPFASIAGCSRGGYSGEMIVSTHGDVDGRAWFGDALAFRYGAGAASPFAGLLPSGARMGRRSALRWRRVGVDSAHQPDHRDLRFLQTRESLAAEKLITQFPIERLIQAVLPLRPRLDVQGLHANLGQPPAQLVGDKLRAVVTANMLRRSTYVEYIPKRFDHFATGDAALHFSGLDSFFFAVSAAPSNLPSAPNDIRA